MILQSISVRKNKCHLSRDNCLIIFVCFALHSTFLSLIFLKETGVYECIASNTMGSVSHRARINIMGSLYIKPIGNITAIVGHSVTINCSFAGYPIDEVYFLKGKKAFQLLLYILINGEFIQ